MHKKFIFLTLSLLFVFASKVEAATNTFEVSGWIPYWRSATGTEEALVHLNTFKEINPFGYTVKVDGTLNDAMKVDEEPWLSFIKTAQAKKVRIVPTVMSGSPEIIHNILSNKKLRDAHIKNIVAMVNSHNFDGVDIDYEAKYSETKDYYSIFLRDLYKAMGKKFVQCEVEARTPVASRYDRIPLDYDPRDVANDYKEINKYCDRVRIMAYDQGTVDLKLRQQNGGSLYAPVADPRWVEEVVTLAMKDINKKKIVLGIPTYGYEYIVTNGGIGGYSYKSDGALNPNYALDIAKTLNITPTRTKAGELSLIYYPTATSTPINGVRNDLQTNLLVWSDAKAIKDKVDLAHRLGLKGVAIFKIDGGADPAMWSILK